MIRIFGVVNHLAHNYELLKLAQHYPIKFSYLLNNNRRWSRGSARPYPPDWLTKDQFEWVTEYEPGKYDLAILSVDQWHVDPDVGKGWIYRDLNEIIQDIPKIVINHGTPMSDSYDEDMVINGGEVIDRKGNPKKLMGIKQKIGDNFMVVNSYTANKRWGWGYPIIHGLDPKEWWDLPKETRVVLPLSPGGGDKYYNRELITHIKSYVHEKCGMEVIHTNVNYDPKDWDDYRRLIGSSLISIAPYKDSPMPRSRTEAMLSGQCVLTSKYQDAHLFIEQGVNGFIIPDNPLSYAETIFQLINYGYKDAIEIGQRGKETALKYFKLERWMGDWWFVINEVLNGRRPEWDGKTTIYGKDYE